MQSGCEKRLALIQTETAEATEYVQMKSVALQLRLSIERVVGVEGKASIPDADGMQALHKCHRSKQPLSLLLGS